MEAERIEAYLAPTAQVNEEEAAAAERVPYNDIDLSRWKEYPHVETGSLWLIPTREKANGHRLEYHGNFVPQIATQLLTRYTRERDVVLDLFMGCGTTAIEAVRLNRRCLGVELKPELCEHVAAKLPEAFADGHVRLLAADSTSSDTRDRLRAELRSAWDREDADLLILHPPYGDIIRFSDDPADLSNAEGTESFLTAFRQVAAHGFELLRPGRFAALVIGDKYQGGELTPLGFLCMQRMIETGFRTKSIVVKNIEGNEVGKGRAGNLWRYRALRGGFYIFKHEYVMIFQKPARQSAGR